MDEATLFAAYRNAGQPSIAHERWTSRCATPTCPERVEVDAKSIFCEACLEEMQRKVKPNG